MKLSSGAVRRALSGALFVYALLGAAPRAAAAENKVIVADFKWQVYATEHFDIHYYGGAQDWARYAGGVLEKAYRAQAAAVNPELSKRIPFFLFSSINDMQQSGIADVGDGVGGLTEPYKDRFMAWSDGSRGWLKEVMEHEFAHEAEFSVLIDGFWKSARILKTFIYPLWMMEGYAETSTGGQDYALEKMYVRDAVLGGFLPRLERLSQFGHLKPHQTTLAYKTGAQAMRFLSEQYGEDKPGKMLALYRTRYDADSVLLPLIGTRLRDFDRKFREYLKLKYTAEAAEQKLREPGYYGRLLTRGSEAIPEFNVSPALSPDGKKLAWLSTREGHPPIVVVRDLATGRETRLTHHKAGAENIPYGRFTKPLRSLAWSPDGKYLAFSGQKNHREYLYLWDPAARKVVRTSVDGLAEVRQPVFSPDGGRLAFVGMRGGYNDIYEAPLAKVARGGALPPAEAARLTSGPQDESSPAYAPDGSGLAYSCEVETSSGPQRRLCFLPAGGAPRELPAPAGNVYDPAFSPDGKTLYFNSDADENFDLYSVPLAGGEPRRLTRSLGGAFTPLAAGDKVYFSAFRKGEMHLVEADAASFLSEPAAPAAAAQPGPQPAEPAASTGTFRPYRFSASTDLFFPAFMFSSPGGLFWMNYWQASDMLGRHNLALYLNYNSGAKYTALQASYAYTRWRMPLYLDATVLASDRLLTEGFEYEKRYSRSAVGTAWPFDRYNRVEAVAAVKDETNTFKDFPLTERLHTRYVQAAFVRDTVDGLYLAAVRGARTEAAFLTAGEAAGGNMKYDVWRLTHLQYFPLSKRSAVVNNFTAGLSVGRDRRYFSFGGLGGLRGFRAAAAATEKPGVLLDNAELRVPLFRDVDSYMWYMFPDFYFKGVYGKVFADLGYGWDRGAGPAGLSLSKVDSSVGAGVDVHTFILQTFHMVLSFDWAVRTSDGGKIFYFYLGPMF